MNYNLDSEASIKLSYRLDTNEQRLTMSCTGAREGNLIMMASSTRAPVMLSVRRTGDWANYMDRNRYLIDLSESKRTDFGRVDFAKQTEVQKVFSAVLEIESQVTIGGFDQYFRNK